MVGLGVRRENIFVCDSQRRDPRRARRRQGRQARREQAALLPAHRGAHAGRRGERRRRLPGLLGRRRPERRDGDDAWPPSPSSWRWPTPSPRSGPNWPRRRGPTASSPPGAATTRTRSTTSCASPTSSAARWTAAPPSITEAMKLACVREIAALAKAETSDEVAAAYSGKELKFGPEYIIPTPFDVRLILRIAPAVAKAAAESGVAARPIADLEAYRQSLGRFVYQTGMFMRPVFAAAKRQQCPQAGARGLCRGRRRARAARGAGGAGRRAGAAHPGGPARGGEDARRARRAAAAGRARLRVLRPRERPTLPRLLGALPQPDGARRRHARSGQGGSAALQYADLDA